MVYRRILVPLDGTKGAERAIPVAARLARAAGGAIVFVRVVPPPVEFGKYARQHSLAWEKAVYHTQRAQAASYLAGMMLAYAGELAGIEIEIEVATGITIQTIFAAARQERADLIVLCGHREMGPLRWLFGSVTREAGRRSPVPVLVLRERAATLRRASVSQPLRVLVPLDGSPLAEAALVPAAQLACALNSATRGNLHLLRVTPRIPNSEQVRGLERKASARRERAIRAILQAEDYLRAVADNLRASLPQARQLTITTSVRAGGKVAATIVAQAEQENDCDLVVMARQGHSGLHRLLSDNVAEHILDASQLPLLLVRPYPAGGQESAPEDSHRRSV